MDCVICKSGTMKAGNVTVTLQRNESIIVVKKVSAQVCENCGEYTLSEDVTRKLMDITEQAISKNTEVEILQYAA